MQDYDDYSYCTPAAHRHRLHHHHQGQQQLSRLQDEAVTKKSLCEKKKLDRVLAPELTCDTPSDYPVTAVDNRRGARDFYAPMPVNGKKTRALKSRTQADDVDAVKPPTINGGGGTCSSSSSVASHHSASSSKSGDVYSSPDEGMDMKYTDMTHDQLKTSLARIATGNNAEAALSSSAPTYKVPLSTIFATKTDARRPNSACRNNGFSHDGQLSRFDAILRAKDAMLQEKDSVILKLRLQAASLGHKAKEGAAAYEQVVRSQDLKLIGKRATSMENQKWTAASSSELQKVLGRTEFELQETTAQLERERRHWHDKCAKLDARARDRDQQLADGQKKYRACQDKLAKYKKRTESLERYLGDLPTIDETRQLKAESTSLADERQTLVAEIEMLKDKLEARVTEVSEATVKLREAGDREEDHRKQEELLRARVEELEAAKDPLDPSERDEHKDLKFEVEHLRREQADTAKVLASCNLQAKQQGEKHRSEVERMQALVDEARDEADAIRQEMRAKQLTSDKVNKAMVALSSQNQTLMEQNLMLQDKAKQLERQRANRSEDSRLHSRLQNELFSSVRDLKSVTQLLVQTVEGTDLNLTNLLGVNQTFSDPAGAGARESTLDDEATAADEERPCAEALRCRVTEVRRLREDIDHLRTLISNRYAENIGDNCTTQ